MKLKFANSKTGAMEMSVGTMVTIVLLMVVLVLGIFFIQKIFKSGTNAIDSIDSQVQSEIEKLFAKENTKVGFYPTSREVSLKKGDDPAGFAFSIKNNDIEEREFSFTTTAVDASKCGAGFDEEDATDMLLGGSGTFGIGPGDKSESRLVKFVVPESTPPCTIEYELEILRDDETTYVNINFFLTIK